ncbi:MAG TPA: hypothetical protein VJV05_05735 [Pyrinomonadaceae bacterium]|nr:hypothetical protein [Pyrinomonadaceae bacterium]
MQEDQKPRFRIIAERINVTTIRTRSNPICEICRRSLDADEMNIARASELTNEIKIEGIVSATDKEKEK